VRDDHLLLTVVESDERKVRKVRVRPLQSLPGEESRA